MSQFVPIQYRDFWDVPRIFLVEHRGHVFLFDCPFNQNEEDFPGFYRIYLLAGLEEKDLKGSWEKLADKAIHCFGEVPIEQIRLDSTKREKMEVGLLEELISQMPKGKPPVVKSAI